jgi:glycine betaine/proline transport system ATP-binding protein
MRAVDGDGHGDGPTVQAGTVVQELIPMVASADATIRVVDGDTVIGLVDRAAVIDSLIEDRG